MDLFDPVAHGSKKILIVGAGGIWSTTAYTLAKMGCSNITVVDFDEVEIHNCSSQFFSAKQIGMKKVEALKQNVSLMADEEITAIDSKFLPKHVEGMDILILALDNMETRAEVVKAAKDNQFIIDPRMVKKLCIVNTLYGNEFERTKWLSEEMGEAAAPEEVACTSKAVAFNAVSMAGLVSAVLAEHLNWGQLCKSYQMDTWNFLLYKFQ